MKRIARNATKKIDALFAAVTKATSYTLANEFRGESVSLDHVRAGLKSSVADGRGRLFVKSDGRLLVEFHSNSWIVLEVGA